MIKNKKIIIGTICFSICMALLPANSYAGAAPVLKNNSFNSSQTKTTKKDNSMELKFNKDTVTVKKVTEELKDIQLAYTYENVKKVEIAEGVKSLPLGLFYIFPNVEEIVLSSTVNSVESGFYSYNEEHDTLKKLKKISVPKKNKTYKSVNGILYSKDGKRLVCYPYAKKDKSFTVPDSKEYIHIENAYLKTITLGASTENISLELPALQCIKVNDKNPAYKSIDGVLYTKDGAELVQYPAAKGKSYTIANGTLRIKTNAFFKSNIVNVKFPDSLRFIDTGAFFKTNVKSITLGKNFSALREKAFENSALETIEVSSENEVLASEDGVLYNKDKTKLLYWPESKVMNVLQFPSTLTSLDLHMIPTVEQSYSIVIPKSLTSIVHTEKNQFSKIDLSSQNTSFILNQGILYTKNMTAIQLYPNKNPITNIILPDNVMIWDWEMFSNENTTTAITLSKNLQYFKECEKFENGKARYFSGFYHLQSIQIPEENAYYKVIGNVMYTKNGKKLVWYPQNSRITNYQIPDGVIDIADGQLINAANLENLTIPKTVTLLGGKQDYEIVDMLREVNVIIGTYCPKLKAIHVDKENPLFVSDDGVLYNSYKSTLMLYPSGKEDKEFIIPSGVTTMNTTTYNPYLEKLTLSDQSIGLYEDSSEYRQESNPFLKFTALKEFAVSDKKGSYKVMDGVLYNGGIMVAYPMAKTSSTLTLPSDLTAFNCSDSLRCAGNLKKIDIKENKYLSGKNGELHVTSKGDKKTYANELAFIQNLNQDQNTSENDNGNAQGNTNVVKPTAELVDFTYADTYYAYEGSKKKYSGEETIYVVDTKKPFTYYVNQTETRVKHVIIAEGMIHIPFEVFSLLPNVEDISIPSTLTNIYDDYQEKDGTWSRSIGNMLLTHYPKLKSVKVAAENAAFCSIDGVMYDKEVKTLYCYPSNKPETSYVVPDTVVDFGGICITKPNSNLTEITIGAFMQEPNYYFMKQTFPNLSKVSLSPYNLYFLMKKDKYVRISPYRR